MGTRPNFDPSLRRPDRPDQSAAVGGLPGPSAGGPAPGGTLTWVYVWIIQNGPDGHAAAASGEGDNGGTGFKDTWAIETKMSTPDDFKRGEPALATAMALVDRGGRDKEVDWWSEAVLIARS